MPTFKVSATKAYKVEVVQMDDGKEFISIRQMYATKSDPTFKHGRQGIMLPRGDEVTEKVIKALKKRNDPDAEVEVVKLQKRNED